MKTLHITTVDVKDRSITVTYAYDAHKFSRAFTFAEHVQLHTFNNDVAFNKLVKYIAISDAIYTFGLGYYDEIVVPFSLSKDECNFFEETLFHGLAEFRLANDIPIHTQTKIHAQSVENNHAYTNFIDKTRKNRAFVLNGGGKDGAVAMEVMKQLPLDLAWFSSGNATARNDIALQSGIDNVVIVDRYSDGYVQKHKLLHGHKPMSLYVAMISALSAYIDNRYYVVAACEYSASHPNTTVEGLAINHQYTKSFTFEKNLRNLFEVENIPVYYFSITRPLYDIQIMELFSKFPQYHRSFISCNQTIHEDKWCMNCSKCAFVIGAMYVYAPKSATEIWGNIADVYRLNDGLLHHTIDLINPNVKPFECIGTTDENLYLLKRLLIHVKMTPEQRKMYDSYVSANQDGVDDSEFHTIQQENNFPQVLSKRIEEILKGMIL